MLLGGQGVFLGGGSGCLTHLDLILVCTQQDVVPRTVEQRLHPALLEDHLVDQEQQEVKV